MPPKYVEPDWTPNIVRVLNAVIAITGQTDAVYPIGATGTDEQLEEVPDGPTIAALQRVDPYCSPIMEYLDLEQIGMAGKAWASRQLPSGEKIPEAADECWIDDTGVLRRPTVQARGEKHRRGTEPHAEDDRGVIVVPAALVQPMLKLFHDSHPGIAAAQQLMSRELWWPRMTQDIVRYCTTCHICDSFKPSRASQKTPMGMFEESPLPAEEVCVDVLGPLPANAHGHKYLLVIVDRYSRWIHAEPMKGQSISEILDAFMLYVWRRGCPRIIYSDRQGSILSTLAQMVYDRLGVKQAAGSGYRWNASAMVERGIGSLLTLLRCNLAGEKVHSGWPERLPQVLWYMNTLPNAGTGFSPFYLEHGRDPRSVASRALDTTAAPKKDQPWLATLRDRLDRADIIQKRVHTDEMMKRQRL